MKTVTLRRLVPASPSRPRLLDALARRVVRSRLAQLQGDEIAVVEGERHDRYGHSRDGALPAVTITIRDPGFYSDIALGGVIGSAEAYMRGYWDCDDLTSLVRIMLRNRALLGNIDRGWARLAAPARRMLHWLNRNTRSGSRRNISAHYDLGNDFYELWLDRNMMYSSAVFECPEMTLDDASIAKLDRICRKLRLKESDHVLEIGTGWGGFAIHAARKYGCRVTTTTISREQHDYAAKAICDAGLDDRITLLFRDYRDLDGQFDKLVSIEMIEAVGWQYQDAFFAKCAELLKTDGEMLLQAITIADQDYERYKRSVDFIRRYIFPGGCLCSVTSMSASLTRVTDMRIAQLEDIGPHYARTLKLWRNRFIAARNDVAQLGYPDEFIRLWLYYLCYCEGAFVERAIGDVQMHLVKPGARVDVLGR